MNLPPRILVRDLLKSELTEDGYEVVLAGTGRRAVGLLKRSPVDLVLVDTVLSDLDGEDALSCFEEAGAPPLVGSCGESSFCSRQAALLR